MINIENNYYICIPLKQTEYYSVMKKIVVKITFAVCLFTLIFSSCGQDEITYQLNSKLVEMKCDNTFALQITPTLEGMTYTSLNPNIATVSNSGLIKAKLVGTTKIVVKNTQNSFIDTVKVVVNTLHTAFANPNLSYGASADEVLNSIDLTKYYYTYRQYETFDYMYMYDQTATEDYTYYYFFSKDDKLILSNVYLENNGEVEWHLSDRYNNMRAFSFSNLVTTMYITSTENGYDTTTVTNTYNFVDSYFINPDSSLIVFQETSNRAYYADIYYFKGSKELIESILSAEEENGKYLFYWLYYSKLYPDEHLYDNIFESPKKKLDVSTMNMVLKHRQPEIIREPEKQLH